MAPRPWQGADLCIPAGDTCVPGRNDNLRRDRTRRRRGRRLLFGRVIRKTAAGPRHRARVPRLRSREAHIGHGITPQLLGADLRALVRSVKCHEVAPALISPTGCVMPTNDRTDTSREDDSGRRSMATPGGRPVGVEYRRGPPRVHQLRFSERIDRSGESLSARPPGEYRGEARCEPVDRSPSQAGRRRFESGRPLHTYQ